MPAAPPGRLREPAVAAESTERHHSAVDARRVAPPRRATGSPRARPSTMLHPTFLAVLAGTVGAAALLAFYLGIITWAQGSDHALSQFQADAWFIGPITLGFGLQVALFFHLRRLHAAARGGLAVTAGSAGVSTGAMLACCAHHLGDVLPILGIGGAAIFLNDAKTPLALAGMALNGAGVAYLLFRVRRSRCSVASASIREEVTG